MGVKGLWKVIESAGVPVPLETLEHKVLGVDVSIWLHQAVRGFRGPGGAAVANAHLLTLFHRICKLLFYRIRPIFVFDGGVPHLKKQTQASRKLRKEVATNKARQVRERLFKNLLKSQAVRTALGKSGPGPSSVHVPQVTKREKDIFELPPLSEALVEEETGENLGEESSSIVHYDNLPNLHQFDFESVEFKNLPLDSKHEILSELQGTRKQNSWANINDMPQQSENFAEFQMARLMKRAKFQATLDSTRDEIQKVKVSEMETELFGNIEKYMSFSKRIISEDASHAIFVKKVKETNQSNSETMDVGSHLSTKKTDRKGKAPLKRKKPIDKDFLTELAKTGIIRPGNQDTDSDSDVERDDCYLLHEGCKEDWNDSWQQCSNEEESFLQVVGSLMENSGLTQDEILALIKQDQRENPVAECSNEIYNGPSTSANAPGNIFNPDDSSSDEDDFIEVSAVQPPQVEKDGGEKETSANNVEKLLGTKTNSLWMKIVQQKVDDMVHVNTLKTSPKKAIVDSRKLENESIIVKEPTTSKELPETLRPVKISLDFDIKPLKMEDNIFSDIFTDFICQPKSTVTNELVTEESQGSRQSVRGQDKIVKNSQMKIDNVDLDRSAETKLDIKPFSTEISDGSIHHANLPKITGINAHELDSTHVKCRIPLQNGGEGIAERSKTEKDGVTHDEVEIMSSSDETDDEHEITVSTIKNQSSSKTIHEHKRANTLQQVSYDKEKSNGLERDHKNNGSSETSKFMVLNDKKIGVQHPPVIGQDCIEQATKTTSLDPIKSSCVELENNTLNNRAENGISLEVGSRRKVIDIEGKKDEEEIRVSPHQSDDNSGTVLKYKNSSEGSSSPSKVDGIILSDDSNYRNGNTNEDIKQKADVSTKEDFIDEAESYKDINLDENWESDTDEIMKVQETEVERPLDYTQDELKHLEGELASEQQALIAQAQRCERLASSLNDQMYGESQHLLQLFGIPYLVAPMEAEAQCAFLNAAKLTEGTITDDSDIFLFGGNSVYRNFFNQTRHVEHFKAENIKSTLGLQRSKMITMALLCGSDYTEGLEGIGSVSAMEILAEFPGDGIECLQNLRKWWNVTNNGISTIQYSKIKQKLAQINLPDSFPNERVYEAYFMPEVDESKEKFTWAVPNVEALRVFTGEKFGWNFSKTDEILLPVMKRLKLSITQKRIESYFTNIRLVKEPKVASKRMLDAIAKTKGTMPSNDPTKQSFIQGKVMQKQKKKKVRKDPEGKHLTEKSRPSTSDDMADTKDLPPSRTLLVDPSEIENKSVTGGRKGKKRKKDFKEDNNEFSERGTQRSEIPKRKVTKEDMFKHLLEKETISQREKEKLEMQEKKKNAANILHNKMKKR